jgi:serine/threonine protein kinase/tetratricopeptide (TPR) repeat protein
MSEFSQDEKAIFLAALERESAQEREMFLRDACMGDPELLKRIKSLLSVHEESQGPLDAPAPGVGLAVTTDQPVTEGPGTIIGPFKLREQIGEGGFGLVFMAEQQQPLRRKVAVKVIKPGMDSRQVIARFEAERQALALMDHPNIARVLDAGETEGCRPYFAMELVRGVPITDYCDEQRSAPRARLELFVSVCQAVMHAHQKGIIHRDIKPTNVLVTLHDGVPVVKVIDFGIAKALGQQLTDKTLCTGFAQLVGTPLYMSPEQAELSGLDIDTRSDIYSLGVLLYELLTGTTPFDKKRLREVGYDEMRRIIREEEPPRPSTRLSTLGQAAVTVSERRQSDPRRLSQLFRGELDWIVMKALEKGRNRRYETASAFAADIEHYLKDEPVAACPPSVRYRLRKFMRRNRGPILAVNVILLALLVGIIGTTIGLLKVRRERDEKEHARSSEVTQREQAVWQRNRAEASYALLLWAIEDYLVAVTDNPRLKQNLILRKDLLAAAERIYQQLVDQQENDPTLQIQRRLGKVYYGLGSIREALGEYAKAQRDLERGKEIYYKLVAEDPAVPEYRRELGACLVHLGNVHSKGGRNVESETCYRAALELSEKIVVERPDNPEYRLDLAKVHSNLAILLDFIGKPREAEIAFDNAVRVLDKAAVEFPKEAPIRIRLASIHSNRGTLLQSIGRLKEAEEAFREAVRIEKELAADRSDGPTRKQLITSHHNLGNILANTGRLKGAEESYRAALDVVEKLVSDFASVPEYRQSLGYTLDSLASLLYNTSRFKEAESYYRRMLDIHEKLVADYGSVPQYRVDLANGYNNFGLFLRSISRPKDAEQTLRKALTLKEQIAAEGHTAPDYQASLASGYFNLAMLLQNTGRLTESETPFRQALALQTKLVADGPQQPQFSKELANTYSHLGVVLQYTGRAGEAEKAYTEASAIQEQLVVRFPNVPEYHSDLGATLNNLGMLACDRGYFQKSRQYLEKAVVHQRLALQANPQQPTYRWYLRNHYFNLAETVLRLDEYASAADAAEEMVKLFPGSWQEASQAFGFLMRCADRVRQDSRLSSVQQPKLAQIYSDRGRKLVRQVAEQLAHQPMALNNLAWALVTGADRQNQDPDLAIELAHKALEDAPNSGVIWNTLGVAQYRASNFKDASMALEKSVEFSKGGNGVDWFFLAMSLEQLKEKEKARRWYDKAVEWMDKNKIKDEQLLRYREEAAELLGVKDKNE